MEYESRLLVLDGPDGDLQSLAMELLELDYAVHYANDPFEAQLIAKDEREHLRAILLSSSIHPSEIPELGRRFGLTPESFVPTGTRPQADVVDQASRDGVRWHLWDSPCNQAIRLVISSVLSERDPYELRLHLRIPVELKGKLQIGDSKADVDLRDISIGGACIVGHTSVSDGDLGLLSFAVGETPVELPVQTCWSTPNTDDGVQVLGVTFTEVDPESGHLIDGLVDDLIGRQRINAGRKKKHRS